MKIEFTTWLLVHLTAASDKEVHGEVNLTFASLDIMFSTGNKCLLSS